MKLSIQKICSFYLTFPVNGKKGFGLFFNCIDGCNFSSKVDYFYLYSAKTLMQGGHRILPVLSHFRGFEPRLRRFIFYEI